jgi:hypothetical protein
VSTKPSVTIWPAWLRGDRSTSSLADAAEAGKSTAKDTVSIRIDFMIHSLFWFARHDPDGSPAELGIKSVLFEVLENGTKR